MDVPPPPPPPAIQAFANPQAPKPPVVAATGPAGAFTVELLIYNGFPFKDHWAYFVPSHEDPEVGVLINAAGDVRNGFRVEIERSHDFRIAVDSPMKRIPLQWVGQECFDEKAMFNHGEWKIDLTPACVFETSASKVKAPEKSLRAIDDKVSSDTHGLSTGLSTNLEILGCDSGQKDSTEELPDLDYRVS